MNTFTTLYTLTSQESIFNVFGILSSATSKWVPTSQSLPTLSTFTLEKPKTTTVTPTYSALPVIVTPDTVYVKAFQHTKAISFYISAANMEGDYMIGVQDTSRYNVKGLDDTSIAATSISGVYVDYTTGLVFGQNYYSNGYKPFTTSVRIFATNKNGTASKVVNLIVGISPPQQGRLGSAYDNNWRSLSANFNTNYVPASRAFAAVGPMNAGSTARYNSDQLETRHIVRACLSPALTAAFINSRPPFNCCGWWETYNSQNTYTYSEIVDENQPNTLYNQLRTREYRQYSDNANTPFIRRFDTPIQFFNTKQPMYWGMVATEINIKKSAYANTINSGISDALQGSDGFDRNKNVWSDDYIPYLYVNPLSSSTIPLSGWLRASSSAIKLEVDGSFIPAFYSSNIHESIYGTPSPSFFTQLGLDIDGEAANDQSGYSVSMNAAGDRVAIGARFNDGNGTESGHTRIYQWNSSTNTWTKMGQDLDGEAANDWSGYSVSMNAAGDRVAIGAILNGSDSGHTRIYQWNSSTNAWTKMGLDINGEASGDESGSVSMNAAGDRVAIGAILNDGNGSNSGHTRIYQWNSSTNAWTKMGQDLDGEATFDWSGYSVSMNAAGDRVAIGAVRNGGNGLISGHVRIYQWNSSTNTWTKMGQDLDGEAANDESGNSVSMNAAGDRVAIGAIVNDGNGTNSGHTRIYQWNSSTNTWTKMGQDLDGEAANDQSGYSVSMNAAGDRVAIGARLNDGNGSNSGHTRIYQWNSSTNTWTKMGQDLDGEATFDQSGYSVSMNAAGDRVAIGARFNSGNGSNSGHVRIYEYSRIVPKVQLSRYTSFTVLSNIIEPFTWGFVPTSGTYIYDSTNIAGYPVYILSGSNSQPVKIEKPEWDEPWMLKVLGPYNSWWLGAELEGDLNLNLRTNWVAQSTISTFVSLPSALPADSALKIKEERGINLGPAVKRMDIGGYVGDFSSWSDDDIVQKVYCDVNLDNEQDRFEYTNSKIIEAKTKIFSEGINRFWSRYSSNILGGFTLPELPILYKMFSRPAVVYAYKPLDILEYEYNYVSTLNFTDLSLTFVVMFNNRAWISTTPPIKDAPAAYINAGLKLPLSSRQTRLFRSYSDLPAGENRLKSVFWNGTNLSYPRIVGNKNGIGHFGPLSAKCYWGIQDTLSSYSAVCNSASDYYDDEGNFASFELPTWQWFTVQNNSSFRETSRYTSLSAVPQLLPDDGLGRFMPQFYYGVKMSDLVTHPLSGIITHGRALVFRGNISSTDFFDPENYINAATKYNTSYVSSDPMVAYGTDLRFGEEQVAALRVLGYL
jgi:hypothetical protein